MQKGNWRTRIGKLLVLAAPGGFVLGTSCWEDVRNSMVSGGLNFVEDSTEALLATLTENLRNSD